MKINSNGYRNLREFNNQRNVKYFSLTTNRQRKCFNIYYAMVDFFFSDILFYMKSRIHLINKEHRNAMQHIT